MKNRIPLAAISIIAISILFLSFASADYTSQKIVDETNIMGSSMAAAEANINELFDQTGVLMNVYLSNYKHDTNKTLVDEAKTYFSDISNLDEEGVPKYNVLIYSAKVGDKQHIIYLHDKNACPNLVDFLNTELVNGEVTLSGETVLEKIKLIADFIIKENNANKGNECASSGEAKKDEMELSVGRSVYLIDDTDWKSVLSLIPLTTWHKLPQSMESLPESQRLAERKNHVQYSPTFIYHSEGEQTDLDSIVRLMEQFPPEKVFISSSGKEVPKAIADIMKNKKWNYESFSAGNYTDKWKTDGYDSIVLSEDDYKTGLMASVFASYMHSPLIFSASELKNYDNYRTLYCIGSVKNEKCTKKYTLQELQKYYGEITGTDKVILVNPKDIDDDSCERFSYFSESGKLTRAYYKDSLVSPILASVKNELMIFTVIEPLSHGVLSNETNQINGTNNFEQEIMQKSAIVKSDIGKQTQMSNNNYLTVFASPKAIPSSIPINVDYRKSLDSEYAEGKSVGRIFGITVSDTSSYVNRVIIFSKKGYSYIPSDGKTREFEKVGMATYDFVEELQSYMIDFESQLSDIGYRTVCFVDRENLENGGCVYASGLNDDMRAELMSSDILLYDDHGTANAWGGYVNVNSYDLRNMQLNSPVVISDTCHGANYYASYEDNLLAANFIRSGALGFYGSVGIIPQSPLGSELVSRIMGTKSASASLEGYDMGNALLSVSKDTYLIEKGFFSENKPFNIILIGDPTVQLALMKKVNLEYKKPSKTGSDYYCYASPQNGQTACVRKAFGYEIVGTCQNPKYDQSDLQGFDKFANADGVFDRCLGSENYDPHKDIGEQTTWYKQGTDGFVDCYSKCMDGTYYSGVKFDGCVSATTPPTKYIDVCKGGTDITGGMNQFCNCEDDCKAKCTGTRYKKVQYGCKYECYTYDSGTKKQTAGSVELCNGNRDRYAKECGGCQCNEQEMEAKKSEFVSINTKKEPCFDANAIASERLPESDCNAKHCQKCQGDELKKCKAMCAQHAPPYVVKKDPNCDPKTKYNNWWGKGSGISYAECISLCYEKCGQEHEEGILNCDNICANKKTDSSVVSSSDFEGKSLRMCKLDANAGTYACMDECKIVNPSIDISNDESTQWIRCNYKLSFFKYSETYWNVRTLAFENTVSVYANYNPNDKKVKYEDGRHLCLLKMVGCDEKPYKLYTNNVDGSRTVDKKYVIISANAINDYVNEYEK